MTKLYLTLERLASDERGQDLIEYALLVGLIATATAAGMPNFTPAFSTIFNRIASVVTNAAA